MRTKRKMWLVVAGIMLAAVMATFAAYFQSFETDTDGWTGATRVPTLTHGVPTKIGAFHAEAQNNQPFTFWGGYMKKVVIHAAKPKKASFRGASFAGAVIEESDIGPRTSRTRAFATATFAAASCAV